MLILGFYIFEYYLSVGFRQINKLQPNLCATAGDLPTPDDLSFTSD